MPEPTSSIDYPRFLRRALLGVVRDILRDVAERGLTPTDEVFLEFRTTAAGVELPRTVVEQYPEVVTIVLKHRTWAELTVTDDWFQVTVQFAGVPSRIRVPFTALTSLVDPKAQFGLDIASAGFPTSDEPPAGPATDDGAPTTTDDKVVAFRRPRRS